MNARKRQLWMVAGIILVLILSACGSSGSGGSGSSSGSGKTSLKIMVGGLSKQIYLPNKLTDSADVLLPGAAWAEKSGCWENFAGKIQPFESAIAPPEHAQREGDVFYKLLGRTGFYNADDVRAEMGAPFASVKLPERHAAEPAMDFVEL